MKASEIGSNQVMTDICRVGSNEASGLIEVFEKTQLSIELPSQFDVTPKVTVQKIIKMKSIR